MIKYLRILRSLGQLCVIISVFMLFPAICALCCGEYTVIIKFFIPAVIAAALGALAVVFTQKYKAVQIGTRLSIVTVVFSWIIAILIGSIPFIFLGTYSFTQSVFESASGWTTTGLTVIDAESAFKSVLLWRSLMQFLGGVGIILVLQLIARGSQTAMLYQAEGHSERVLPNMRRSIMLILGIYCIYTAAGLILYLIGGMSFFDALNHSMTAISTGGFSTKSGSIGAFNSVYIECVTIFLMLLGAVNFAVHILLFTGKFKKVAKVFELRVMGIFLIIAVPLISFVGLSSNLSGGEQFRIGLFETVSTMTTTGFFVSNPIQRTGFMMIFLIILMLVGGSLGSTSGGIKQYRMGIALKSFYWNIKKRVISENKVYQPYIYNSNDKLYLTEDDISKNNTFILMTLFIWVIGSLFIAALSSTSMEQSFFEFAGIIGNTGLSFDSSVEQAANPVLWVKIFGMFLGRLECTIVFVGFSKFFSDCFKGIKKRTQSA